MTHSILFYLVFRVIKTQLKQLTSVGKGEGVMFPVSISRVETQFLFLFHSPITFIFAEEK